MKKESLSEVTMFKILTASFIDAKTKIDALNNLEDCDRYGRTLLINAVYENRFDIVEYLVGCGVNVNIQDKLGNTALHAAVQEDNIEILQFLLKNGAEVNQKNKYGNTPIWGVKPLNTDAISLLLDFGADPYIKNNYGASTADAMNMYPEVIALFKKNRITSE